MMQKFRTARQAQFALAVALTVLVTLPQCLYAEELPQELSDAAFWGMVNEFSEDGGYFRSDNFLSNEEMFQSVIPILQQTTQKGGVYLGVGPEQNFTYIVALEPRIAFIFDIRRQNMLTHLMYKAFIEMSSDRADFLSRLFSRERPEGLHADSSTKELFAAYAATMPTRELFKRNLTAMLDHLIKTHGFALGVEDQDRITYVYNAFFSAGPNINYSFQGFPTGTGRMPTYTQLMTADDGRGQNRSYLATEENFTMLRQMHRKNLIVPLVGDFAGEKAIRIVGRYLRDHEATVTAFYTSNVEQYLFQQAPVWNRFYNNVRELPIDSTSMFIRSVSSGRVLSLPNPGNGRFVSLLSPITSVLDAFNRGRLHYYEDVILLSQ